LVYRLVKKRIQRNSGASTYGAQTAKKYSAALLSSMGIYETSIDRNGLFACGTTQNTSIALRKGLENCFGVPESEADFMAEIESELLQLLPSGIPESPALEGAEATLDAFMQRGIPLGLATSDDYKNTMADLKRLGWLDYFNSIYCADTVKALKPDPWVIHAFAEKTGTKAASVLFVGDTDSDKETAARAGSPFFRVAGKLDLIEHILM